MELFFFFFFSWNEKRIALPASSWLLLVYSSHVSHLLVSACILYLGDEDFGLEI